MTRLPWRPLAAALVLLTTVAVLALFVANLSGGEDGSAKNPTPTAVAGGPDPQGSPFSGGTVIEAVSYYVSNVGLGETKYAVTNPISCSAFFQPEDAESVGAKGKICLDLNSGRFEENAGIITVNLFGEGKSWDLSLELAQNGWRVAGADALSPDG